MNLYIGATQAQIAYLKSLGARALNPYLSEAEAKLIARHLVWTRWGRMLGKPIRQGRIPIGVE